MDSRSAGDASGPDAPSTQAVPCGPAASAGPSRWRRRRTWPGRRRRRGRSQRHRTSGVSSLQIDEGGGGGGESSDAGDEQPVPGWIWALEVMARTEGGRRRD